MTNRAPLAALVALAAVATSAPTAGATTLVCLEIAGDVDGVTSEGLADAVALEARKASVAVRVVDASAEPLCLGAERVLIRVGPATMASIRRPGGASSGLDLADIDPLDRAASVAHLAVGEPQDDVGEGAWDDAPLELIDTGEDVVVPPSADPAPTSLAASASPPLSAGDGDSALGGSLTLEGGYGFQPDADAHRIGGSGELTVTFFRERLALGVAAGWYQGTPTLRNEVDAEESAAEMMVVARGGFWAGPVLLRLGLRAGWQWRWLEATTELRVTPLEATSGAGVFDADLEAAWAATDWLRIGLALRGRVFAGGADHVFAGELVAPAPEGELGAVIRMGVTL